MSLSNINYAERAKRAGLNVHFVAEGTKDYEIRLETVVPANPTCNGYSVAKAFTVTAVGILYDRGLVTPETKVYELLGEHFPDGFDPRWKEVTLHHAMLHTMGIDRDCADIDGVVGKTYPTGTDYLAPILSLPLVYEPGVFRKYTDAAYYLLSRAVEAASGKDPAALLRPFLMEDMGFSELAWSVCPQGHCIGASGLYIRTEDMVKLGILYLNGGVYKGKRILSEEWVDLVLKNGYALSPRGNGWYAKGGMRGQMIAINPALGRAVAWNSFDKVPFDSMIYPSDSSGS